VTGSAVGIGRAIAIALAQEGANVACLDIDAQNNAVTAAEVQKLGRHALALECDIADKAEVQRAFHEIGQLFGRADVLVNNAAVYIDCALTHGDFASQAANFERSVSICAYGALYCALSAVPFMRQAGGGEIVNVITEHVFEGYYQTTSPATGYDVAKAGLWRLTDDWAHELKDYNIRVNAICPGATDTPMLRAVSVEIAQKGMRPETVAEGVLNIIRQGPEGPTGKSYLVGPSQSAMSPGGTTGPADVARILQATA
jgi:NAD(P)-dependent dehydrogenase (short-subunit alcohol dehydrogenase family)